MKKLTVFIEGRNKEITLDESLVISHDAYIYVKTASVFWEYNNMKTGIIAFSIGSSNVSMNTGYYTFNMIKKLFPTGTELKDLKYNGKCQIINSTSDDLHIDPNLAKMLGFSITTTNISPGTSTSPNQVDINSGLRYIKVSCNLVDILRNFNSKGGRDHTLISLPITTTQPLFGSVQSFYDIESKVGVNKGVINQLRFTVTDQDDKPVNIGRILLECYIM